MCRWPVGEDETCWQRHDSREVTASKMMAYNWEVRGESFQVKFATVKICARRCGTTLNEVKVLIRAFDLEVHRFEWSFCTAFAWSLRKASLQHAGSHYHVKVPVLHELAVTWTLVSSCYFRALFNSTFRWLLSGCPETLSFPMKTHIFFF